ncbi:hypothetical protein DYB31_005640 [Aphanomyces astaci]|nr:hypothetical protein DYB31_005640 [Aphanomyces astaci]
MHVGVDTRIAAMNQSEEKWGHRRNVSAAATKSTGTTKFDSMMAEVDDIHECDAKAIDDRFTKQLRLARAAIREKPTDEDNGSDDQSDDEVTTGRLHCS